jgi:hypothetical protein
MDAFVFGKLGFKVLLPSISSPTSSQTIKNPAITATNRDTPVNAGR